MPGVQYLAPQPGAVTVAFAAHTVPLETAVTAAFASDSRWQQVGAQGVFSSAIGNPMAWLYAQFVAASSIGAPSTHPQPAARWVTGSMPEYTAPTWSSVTAGAVYQCAPTVDRFTAPSTQPVQADGVLTEAFGYPVAGNQTEWLSPSGICEFGTGTILVRNQHEFVSPTPIGSPTPEPGVYRKLYSARQITARYPRHRMRLSRDVTGQMLPPGVPSVEFINNTIKPRSFYGGEGGDPVVVNKNRYIRAGNVPSGLEWGSPTAYNRSQYLMPGGFDASAPGLAFAQGGIRELQVQPIAAPSFGSVPWLSFSPRFVSPTGVYVEFRSTHAVGGTRWITSEGFDAARWGERIIPAVQQVAPSGFVGAFGLQKAWNYTSLVAPQGVRTYPQESDHWGFTRLHNSRQYIEQFPDPESGLSGERWSPWTAVENRNRTVATHSTAPQVPPRPFIWNKAAPILPSGAPAPANPETYKAGLVAYRIRRLQLAGIEPPYILGWNHIRNAARVLGAAGFDATRAGTCSVESNRRFLPPIGASDQAAPGTPMVAYAIRTLVFEPRYTIAPPRIELPNVRLKVRYLEPPSVNTDEMLGGHHLHIHWNKFYPRWIHTELFGWAQLRNLTPELRTHGRNAEEFGDTTIRTQWRTVEQAYPSAELWGRAKISDRTQTIKVSGGNYMRLGAGNNVVRIGGLPNFTQYLYPDGYALDSTDQVPQPSLQQQVLYVVSKEAHDSYGIPVVTANSIRVEPGIQQLVVGEPHISQHTRYIQVRPWEEPQFPPIGNPDLSPRTIWAVIEAPEQAKRNHPSSETPNPVNSGARMGAPSLTHRIQFIAPLWRPSGAPPQTEVFGTCNLVNRKKVIQVPGHQSYRSGWQRVLGGIDYVEQEDGHDSFASGAATVSRAELFIRHVKPNGFQGAAFGHAWGDNLHRALNLLGYVATQMGSSRTPDSDYKRQSLHVGAPKPTIPTGFEASLFGTTWVSNKIRDVFVPGNDHFRSEYEPQSFAQRMRVKRAAVPRHPITTSVAGVLGTGVGVPGLRPGAQYIRPDGNMDNFRKGAPT